MRKLTKEDVARKELLALGLTSAKTELEAAINKFNEELAKIFEPVALAETKYNEAVSAANEFREDIAREIQDYIDDRSQEWVESDRAQSYDEWLSNWDTEFDQVDIQEPEDLEVPDMEEADNLRNMEDEVAS